MRARTPTRTDRAGPDIRWLGALFVLGLGIGLAWEVPAVHETLGDATASLKRKLPVMRGLSAKGDFATAGAGGLAAWGAASGPMDPERLAFERENDPIVREDQKVLQRLLAEAAAAD